VKLHAYSEWGYRLVIVSERETFDKSAPFRPDTVSEKTAEICENGKVEEVTMDYFECIAARRSVRAFRHDPVEDEKLERILEAARSAPTACDYQPFRLLALRTAGREAELSKIYGRPWFVEAPLVLLVCSVPSEAWSRKDGKSYCDVDATIAMDHLVLAATALGLGTCWVGAFDPKLAKELLSLENGWEPLAFTPLGYPAESPAARPRKPLGELAFRL
jgi:nitroreductase